MKTKIVLWGTNAQDERVLIALQLRANENKVRIVTYPESIASPEFSFKMINEWRNSNDENAIPEGGTLVEKDLSITESILPDDLRVERGDLIQRAQTEWHFIVLSTKLHENYKSELADIQDKVGQLAEFSGEVFNSLKGFWNKVQEQVKDRNLFREHADVLRDTTNVLFEELKQKKSALTNEFEENSKTMYAQFSEILNEIEKKIETGIQRFPEIFEDLKRTQSDFKGQKLTRDHSNDLWTRIDVLFKTAKVKKFGNSDDKSQEGSVTERLTHRLEGLVSAIDKMQENVKRDKDDLNFQQKRVDSSQGQLEAQLRQAKINMILERVKSKEEKLKDMIATKDEVAGKLARIKERGEKQQSEAERPDRRKPQPDVKNTVTEQPPVNPVVVESAPAVVEAVAPITVEVPSVSEAPKVENGTSEINEIAANVNAALDAVDKIV